MKALVVTTSYPAQDDDPSGCFVRAEARALARQGHDVHVIAPGGSAFDPPARDPVEPLVTVHRAGASMLFGWPGAAARFRENPARLLAALPFVLTTRAKLPSIGPVDHVFAHWIVPTAFPLLAFVEAPLTAIGHGADVRLLLAMPRSLRTNIVRGLLDRDVSFRFAARASLDALASALPLDLSTRLARASRIAPMALDLPPASTLSRSAPRLRASIDLELSSALAVSVGRLVPDKRVHLAIEACAALDLPLVVVGDGPERAALVSLAKRLGARVHFAGLLPRDEALAWIASSSLLVFTSAAEAAPTVVREARALSVPVVACEAGDVAAWAEVDPGLVTAKPDAHALRATIARVLAASPWAESRALERCAARTNV